MVFKYIFPGQNYIGSLAATDFDYLYRPSFTSLFGPLTFCILPLLSSSWLQKISLHFCQAATVCPFSLSSDVSFKFAVEENIP